MSTHVDFTHPPHVVYTLFPRHQGIIPVRHLHPFATHVVHTFATHCLHTLSTHIVYKHYPYTWYVHAISTRCLVYTHYIHAWHIHVVYTHCLHTLSTHIVYTHYLHTLSLHVIYTRGLHTLSTQVVNLTFSFFYTINTTKWARRLTAWCERRVEKWPLLWGHDASITPGAQAHSCLENRRKCLLVGLVCWTVRPVWSGTE